MKHLLVLLLLTTPVSAATFNISVNGTITNQNNQTITDANLSVGSSLVLTASFDESLLIPWGDTGYSVAGLYGLPTSGNAFFRIDAPGLTWQTSDNDNPLPFFYYESNLSDQGPIQVHSLQPAIIISGDKVVGIMGYLLPSNGPALSLGSGNINGWYDEEAINGQLIAKSSYSIPLLSDQFSLDSPYGAYGNQYSTPGFSGTWDFANSSVVDPPSPGDIDISSVPEPSTWAMFILGFGLVGWRKRHELHLSRV